ncbi:ATP-dependent DNA helicase [Alkalilimnicola ehrlichii]|nr:ATP-dependent DNA helicase [Alkalilimnicola ehrlichii]
MEARRRAQEADVVVVNHHLLLADWALKESGFGEVLPGADVYILDEAHQLPEVAGQFFGLSLSSRQLLELGRDTLTEYQREAGDVPALPAVVERYTRAVLEVRLALGSGARRSAWSDVAERPAIAAAVDGLQRWLGELVALLEPMAVRGRGLEAVYRRAEALRAALQGFLQPEGQEAVQWFESFSQSFILRSTPVDVAEPFRRQMARHPAAWILTSATLSVGEDFSHFSHRVGLEEPRTLRVESPFDYERNTLLYVPQGLPAPTSEAYLAAFLRETEAILGLSQGRAFILFTSHRALREAAIYFQGRLPYPLLVQGEAGQAELLARFREAGNAVLLGTASFWEGVDVRGEALSCVIIDRLPFAAPNDPVLQAKIAALEAAEVNPFMEYQLPLAVISLRQGVGRLIRDGADRGVLVIADNRILTKFYGSVFRRSLPPMPLTREREQVAQFYAGLSVVDAIGGEC